MRHSLGRLLLLCGALPLLSACTATRIPLAPADYGRAVLDTLTTDRYAGRGYDPSNGASRAEAFLAGQFSALGLAPMGTDGYRYPFSFAVARVSASGLTVDGRPLRLGTDYLPLAGSTAGAGEADVREETDPATGDEVLLLRVPTDRTFPLTDSVAAVVTPATRAVVILNADLPAFGGNRFRSTVPVYVVRESAWPLGARRARFAFEGQPEALLQGANVVGAVRGTAVPDSFVVMTAHYDHLGRVRDAFGGPDATFRGANDNASGTAMLVMLARDVARAPLRYTVVFAAMGAEEVGLIGSTALAEQPTWPLDRTRFLVNLDMMGGGPALTVFGGADHAAEFGRLEALLAQAGAPAPTARAQRPNSDHWPFVQRGVPSFFLISGGGLPQPYHSVGDVAGTLDWESWTRVGGVTLELIEALTGSARTRR